MKIYNISDFHGIFDRLVTLYNDFELCLDSWFETSEFTDFFENELENFYPTVEELKEAIDAIVVIKKTFAKVGFADKIISFIYSHLIKFQRPNKMIEIAMSENFIDKFKRYY